MDLLTQIEHQRREDNFAVAMLKAGLVVFMGVELYINWSFLSSLVSF